MLLIQNGLPCGNAMCAFFFIGRQSLVLTQQLQRIEPSKKSYGLERAETQVLSKVGDDLRVGPRWHRGESELEWFGQWTATGMAF